MNNIVTIDFDIIMQPSIESYNVLVDTLYPIDTIIRDYPHMDNAQANLYIYQKLTDMIFKTIKRLESDKIIFIMNHHNVLDCINDYNTLSLVNIDHHHDLGYKDYNYYNNVLDCSQSKGLLILKNISKIFIVSVLLCIAVYIGVFIGRTSGRNIIHFDDIAQYYQNNKDEFGQKIDLNKATTDDLTDIPGVDLTIAKAIISYRKEYGKFYRVSELLDIDGISEDLYQVISQYVSVSDQVTARPVYRPEL